MLSTFFVKIPNTLVHVSCCECQLSGDINSEMAEPAKSESNALNSSVVFGWEREMSPSKEEWFQRCVAEIPVVSSNTSRCPIRWESVWW